jgi:hypothetical protein
MTTARTKTITQKIVVKGFVGQVNKTTWYVYETLNYTGHVPGQSVTTKELDQLIGNGVTVVMRRR